MFLSDNGATLENTITYEGFSKVEKKFPYHKLGYVPNSVIETLKKNGWKPGILGL